MSPRSSRENRELSAGSASRGRQRGKQSKRGNVQFLSRCLATLERALANVLANVDEGRMSRIAISFWRRVSVAIYSLSVNGLLISRSLRPSWLDLRARASERDPD